MRGLLSSLYWIVDVNYRFLRTAPKGRVSYTLRTWVTIFLPEFLVASLLDYANIPIPQIYPNRAALEIQQDPFLIAFADVVILAPILETVFMGGGLQLLRRARLSMIWTCMLSGVAWGVLHTFANGLTNGIMVSWAFFVYSLVYLSFLERSSGQTRSSRTGFWIVASMHMMTNAVCFLDGRL